MATPPPNMEGTDMTGMCFKDQLWLSSYPLDRNLVFDYFAILPFYNWTCNNEQLHQRAIHPRDLSLISQEGQSGQSYTHDDLLCIEVFDISGAPSAKCFFKLGRTLYHINKAFITAFSNLEKIGSVDPENETAAPEPKASKETVDLREFSRVNQILQSLLRKVTIKDIKG